MISLKRIVFPVDLSDQSRRAAPFVKAMAMRFRSELTLVHVMEIPVTIYAPPEAATWSTLVNDEELHNQRQREFDAFLKDDFCRMPATRELLEGEPAFEIVQFAKAAGAGLIMMPTHGYGPFRRFLMGSVTAKVLHDTSCPVWTGVHTPELLAHDPMKLNKILCAVRGDSDEVAMVRWAAEFAEKTGAEVHMIHAIPAAGRLTEESDRHRREVLFQSAREKMESLQNEAGTHFESMIRGGKPSHAIHDAAEDEGADLLIIGRGTHQLGRLRSDDYEIIREAPCPVISV